MPVSPSVEGTVDTPTGAPALVDLKEALSSHRKPDITHVRTPLLNYTARGCEYGDDVYVRANYLRPIASEGYTGTPTAEDFKRCRAYMRAMLSHGFKVIDAMERHQSTDPELRDVEGMKRAVFAADEDASETATRKGVGPSFLPHLAHLASSLNMVLAQAVACGLLPADPGRTWKSVPALAADPRPIPVPEGQRDIARDAVAAAVARDAPFRAEHQRIARSYPTSDCARGRCTCPDRAVTEPGPYWPPPERPESPL